MFQPGVHFRFIILRQKLDLIEWTENEFSDADFFNHFFQSYYLCYSLLTLANEASNFQFFPAHQKVNDFPIISGLRRYEINFDWMFKSFLFCLSLRSSYWFCQLSWKRMLNVTSGRVKNVFTAVRWVWTKKSFSFFLCTWASLGKTSAICLKGCGWSSCTLNAFGFEPSWRNLNLQPGIKPQEYIEKSMH